MEVVPHHRDQDDDEEPKVEKIDGLSRLPTAFTSIYWLSPCSQQITAHVSQRDRIYGACLTPGSRPTRTRKTP
ncbi:hypothetical protein D4764_11G0001170 [Takifugu flavidus]|uniref:Uncharacterized protein n=1 Tax=Takifugu flavidus TaxID=433684 RepID=A0A5C6PG80_9TELE|nr:hypothetical protein D4764_11G0001170 [Takifugu flavidus]